MAKTTQQWVYQELKKALLSGQFLPGHSVTLRGLGDMLGVSITPVRQALQRLVAERALVMHSNRRISVPAMTAEKLRTLCDVRVRLETLAAEQALPWISPAQLDHIWQLNAAVDTAIADEDITGYLQSHRQFHYAIYEAAPTEVLMPLIESVWLQFSPFLHRAIKHIGVDYVVDRHVMALEAIAARDAATLRFAIEADVREGLGSIELDHGGADGPCCFDAD